MRIKLRILTSSDICIKELFTEKLIYKVLILILNSSQYLVNFFLYKIQKKGIV